MSNRKYRNLIGDLIFCPISDIQKQIHSDHIGIAEQNNMVMMYSKDGLSSFAVNDNDAIEIKLNNKTK